MRNRLTILLIGAALAVPSGAALAHGRVGVGISIGVPGPVYVVPPAFYYPAPPVYYAPADYYGPPVYYAPAPWGFAARVRGGHHRGWRRHH